MLNLERLQDITKELQEKKAVTVKALAAKYFASEATIRRDLESLAKSGFVRRTYGGAILVEDPYAEIPLKVRHGDHKRPKEIIAQLAAQLVSDNKIVFIDSSSTALHMIPYLKDKAGLTIITNGARTAVECGESLNGKIYCTGGILRENSLSFIGEAARRNVDHYFTDIAFFSNRAISLENGVTDYNEAESELRQQMIHNTKKAVLLMDSSKFDQNSFCKVCTLDQVDTIITDRAPSDAWIDKLKKIGTELIYPVNS